MSEGRVTIRKPAAVGKSEMLLGTLKVESITVNDTRTALDKHPRPWRVNPDWAGWDISTEQPGPTPEPILDANGKPVLLVSEWLFCEPDVVELIVESVNRG